MAEQLTDKQSQNFERLNVYISKLVDESINKAKRNMLKDINSFTHNLVLNMSENELAEFTVNLGNKGGDVKKKSDTKKLTKNDTKKSDSSATFMTKYNKFLTFKEEDRKVLNLETLKFIKSTNVPKNSILKIGTIKFEDKKIPVVYNDASDKKSTNLYEFLYFENEDDNTENKIEKLPTVDEKEDKEEGEGEEEGEDKEEEEGDDEIKLSE